MGLVQGVKLLLPQGKPKLLGSGKLQPQGLQLTAARIQRRAFGCRLLYRFLEAFPFHGGSEFLGPQLATSQARHDPTCQEWDHGLCDKPRWCTYALRFGSTWFTAQAHRNLALH